MNSGWDLAPGLLTAGDLTAVDVETPARWGTILLKSSAGPRQGPLTAEVFMAPDRSRFRVVDTAGKTEFLSSLQFCKFIIELRASGRFEFERGKLKRKPAPEHDAPPTAPAMSSVFNQPRRHATLGRSNSR